MLIFGDPMAAFYSTNAQATSGLYAALGGTITTSGLPSGNIGSTAMKNIGPNGASIIVPQTAGPYTIGMRIVPTATLSEQEICRFVDNTTNIQTSFFIEANGTISAFRGGSTLLANSSVSAVLIENVWSYLELQLSVSATVGVIGVRINGTSTLQTTGNTKGSGSSGVIGSIHFGSNISSYIQDVYIVDSTGSRNNTYLGDVHLSVYNPTSNGTFTQYTPNGAPTLWQSVSANTPGDASIFASDSTPGDKMSVNLASSSVAGTIAGVIGIGRAKKTDSGTRTANLFALNGSTEVDGSSIALGTSYAYSTQVLEVDPNTSQPFNNSGFNTLQLGCETLT